MNNPQFKEIYKCGILHDLLTGNDPDPLDYVTEDGLTYHAFIELITEMQDEGLLVGVEIIKNEPPICILENADVTDIGIRYLENFMEKINN